MTATACSGRSTPLSLRRSRLAAKLLFALSACANHDPPSDSGLPTSADATVLADARLHRDALAPGEDAYPDEDAVAFDVYVKEDSGAPPPPISVEVGVGETRFEALNEGQTVSITRGPQGGDRHYGFHIWGGVRAHGLAPSAMQVTLTVRTATTDVALSRSVYRLDLMPGDGGDQIAGLRELLSDCCLAQFHPLIMRVEVIDADGLRASDEKQVMGAECPRGLPNPTIAPCP